MTENSFFGGAAVVGLLSTGVGWLKTVCWKIVSLVICRANVSSGLISAVNARLREQKRLPFYEHVYDSMVNYVIPLRRNKKIVFEAIGRDPVWFRHKGWPISVSWTGGVVNPNDTSTPTNALRFTWVRGTFDLEEFLNDAVDKEESHWSAKGFQRYYISHEIGQGRPCTGVGQSKGPGGHGSDMGVPAAAPSEATLFRFLKYAASDIGEPDRSSVSAFHHLAFPSNVESIKIDLQQWKDSKNWYAEKSIPWRRGWLIIGPAGTGKSSLVKALAQSQDVPLRVFDIGTMSNEEFKSAWARSASNAPCIALIEDFDAVFNGRTNVAGENSGGLTFDCLLNTLSGVDNADGVFLVIVTNHPETLDPAMGAPQVDDFESNGISTRPGRIDRVLELGLPDRDCKRRIAERILSDCPEKIEDVLNAGPADSGAQFQERCCQIALQHYWSKPRVKS